MKTPAAHAIVLAIGLALSVGAMAQGMTKVQYETARTGVSAELKLARAACDSFSAHAKDLCLAEASGKEKVATAELNARLAPSEQASYKVRLTRADAQYTLAREKCDDLAGHAKDVCVREAKAKAVTAKANAKAHMRTAVAHDAAYDKTRKAQGVADEKAAQAQAKADDISTAARTDAVKEKSTAAYTVAKEKCDALAGDAKGNCVKDATARSSKP
ncbi:conserved hypothetical protein [Rhodoferax ferrireducens T118]|uniref:Uncharacterized protein n=1 Tax=Albidiferax ferrireducens (strain ATCC BAA-621 / DSM 15236 / T118) TaxID=338969 RepID=Q223L9_ALBFT|nr:hypothetical protein [Rhodoferax ferrireducens]ABD67833.1 conserved hypothetical protein [Rhodoferax ferrireducens T118]